MSQSGRASPRKSLDQHRFSKGDEIKDFGVAYRKLQN